ncbi:hypothetical protein J2X46_000970 [Nocardioides sp. BE266]|uniref:hypothetical protein n=1 Tax=Nocardioides sp. BE266 TaxID=2817725 RepID=UPI002866F1E1|nr:hypothetical protein [Nocardioides sp. BE266]MDR7251994.1 hypothetical protein [Nocardioides sp. BE266]
MDAAVETFAAAFDACFDRCVTGALVEAEWQEEALDATAVAMVEVAVGIRAGEPEPWSRAEQRARELAAERRGTRPGSLFLDRRLTAAQDVVRRPLGELVDALEDLDLEPGDTFTTPAAARSLRDDLRHAVATLVR